MHRSEQVTEQLQHALAARVDTERAIGMLAERYSIPPPHASQRLRQYARDRNHRVHDVAREVRRGRVRP